MAGKQQKSQSKIEYPKANSGERFHLPRCRSANAPLS
jgi:hypothetical protein